MCGLEYKSAIERVLDNNELKVVTDRQLVEDSIEPYRQKGIETKIVEVTLEGESYYSLHRVEDDKILKLNNHVKVDLSDIVT
jgi:TusA-related sulfurtransferase